MLLLPSGWPCHCKLLDTETQRAAFMLISKGVGLIKADHGVNTDSSDQKMYDCFKPFVFDAFVSLSGEAADGNSIRILRDTACSQSVILASALPFSDNSACHYQSVLRGVEMGYVPRPVHRIHIQSTLVTGFFPVAVCTELPSPVSYS